MENGRASKYCPGYGYDVTNRIATFTFGVADVSNDYNELASIGDQIMGVLKNIAENGLE